MVARPEGTSFSGPIWPARYIAPSPQTFSPSWSRLPSLPRLQICRSFPDPLSASGITTLSYTTISRNSSKSKILLIGSPGTNGATLTDTNFNSKANAFKKRPTRGAITHRVLRAATPQLGCFREHPRRLVGGVGASQRRPRARGEARTGVIQRRRRGPHYGAWKPVRNWCYGV